MLTLVYFFYFLCFLSILTFLFKQKHLLMMLISLEFMIIILFFVSLVFFGLFSFSYYFGMIFLSVGVCESVLGISIMVNLIRSYGNDFINSFNSLW
uniref:NADH-ubiquinone oxidoreductase chain 4L n=1 Tax=Passalidae sp. GENSP01 TaxID=1205571 RepID=A0A0S2MRQ2_9SCAR|nr:NADH deshydrogenase subunit 4L [Passalidae sp. GENSP01]